MHPSTGKLTDAAEALLRRYIFKLYESTARSAITHDHCLMVGELENAAVDEINDGNVRSVDRGRKHYAAGINVRDVNAEMKVQLTETDRLIEARRAAKVWKQRQPSSWTRPRCRHHGSMAKNTRSTEPSKTIR
jgi:hypothetical protein